MASSAASPHRPLPPLPLPLPLDSLLLLLPALPPLPLPPTEFTSMPADMAFSLPALP
eukprot:CAMPEP_0178635812 /NCGR_PEP_ID=MMETSP0698-20121128/13380_1 /TAXON_ID=265572 /ORGANISM="Extubocellulus spinifer, Strain CCMP396" /LENGTH=56 /DNA_ID=CAMNT_0020275605 /DNA_START=280 /DNA_END=447 /DNA_ORIENTATION=-